MTRKFHIDTHEPPAIGPVGTPYEWCCDGGCGKCDTLLVEFRTMHHTIDGVTVNERTEPRLVSSCCGKSMFLWKTAVDDEGPQEYNGQLATGGEHVG